MQLVHDMWCHPGNDKMEQIFKARRGRGFPRGFITKLRKFHCATCAVSKRTRRYRRSKRVKVAAAKHVKVAAAKRAPQAHTLRKRTSEQEAQKQDSGTAIKQLPCQGCQRIFESAQVWQVISQIPTAVPALLIIICLQQSRLNVCSSAPKPLLLYIRLVPWPAL